MNPEIKEIMQKEFYIIMGRSGCGKGTQAELLKFYLENERNRKTLHVATGGNFREFIKRDNYTADKTRDTLNTGGLMPEFLAIWNWSNIFIDKLTGEENVILDGAPRKLIEVRALESSVNFYNYKKVTVIYLNVSKDWAIDRLTERGREDDNDKLEQEKKMNWFNSDVFPCINLYKVMSENKNLNVENISEQIDYKFIEINGEQSIEDVQVELISKLVK